MKIYKVFELNKNEVKEELTENDIDNILDCFTMYISDKYLPVFNEVKPGGYYFEKSPLKIHEPVYESKEYLDFVIILKNEWNYKSFLKDMFDLKKRLDGLGFKASGHIYHNVYMENQKTYILSIYKPMFATRKRKIKV